MEDESMSLINYVPSFARGYDLLLVHDNTVSLTYISSLLEQFSFKVTATCKASEATSMISDSEEDRFKLIITKANMDGKDALAFLNLVLERNIPVIFIHSGEFNYGNERALAPGSLFFLEEPIRLEDLKYIWQNVYPSTDTETQNANMRRRKRSRHTKNKQVVAPKEKRKEKRKERRKVENHKMQGTSSSTQKVKREEKKTVTNEDSCSSAQMNIHNSEIAEERRSNIWSPELRLKFIEALSELGENDARPKAILRWMNEPNLTTRQVASYMQKFKARQNRIMNGINSDLPPETEDAGLPATTDSLNESQNKDQFLVNYPETEESEIMKMLETPCNPDFITEFTNCGIQGDGFKDPAASMNQNQPATEDDDLINMLKEDCWDSIDWFGNGTDSADV